MNLDDRIRAAFDDFDSAVRAEVETPPLEPRRPRVAPFVAVAASVLAVALGVGWLNRPAPIAPAASVVPTTTTVAPAAIDLPALVAPVNHDEYAHRVEFLERLMLPTRETLEACLQQSAPEPVLAEFTDPLLFDPFVADVLFPDLDRIGTEGFRPPPLIDGHDLGPCSAVLTASAPGMAAVESLTELWWGWFDILQTDPSDPSLGERANVCMENAGIPADEEIMRELSTSDPRWVGEVFAGCTRDYYAAVETERIAIRPDFLDEHATEVERVTGLIDAALGTQRTP